MIEQRSGHAHQRVAAREWSLLQFLGYWRMVLDIHAFENSGARENAESAGDYQFNKLAPALPQTHSLFSRSFTILHNIPN